MHERQHDPPPLRTDDRRVIAVGTLGWLVILIGLIIWRGAVRDAGFLWWYPMSVCGVVLGLLGLYYLRVRPAQLARREAALAVGADRQPDPPVAGS